jgi:hypothetical protein
LSEIEGKATAMKGRREKEKVKRGRLRQYDPLDFSPFTASKNAAGGLFLNRPRRGVERKIDVRR